MSEGQHQEFVPSRTITPASFGVGSIKIPIDMADDSAWIPSKSYVRIGLTLNGSGAVAPTLSQMVALADNIGGNVFSNASIRVGQTEISSITTGLSQASALNARIDHGAAWLDSLGSGASLNVAKFFKRNLLTASGVSPDSYLGAENEMYKPVAAGHFDDATVDITRTFAIEIKVDKTMLCLISKLPDRVLLWLHVICP